MRITGTAVDRLPAKIVWLLPFVATCVGLAACGGGGTRASANAPDAGPSEGDTAPYASSGAEATWLDDIGRGDSQTDRVCARGHADPVARALCAKPRANLQSLTDLYAALRLGGPDLSGRLALAASSSGLSNRIVSALNPRVFVTSFAELPNQSLDNVVATAFVRGEPHVELVGYDDAAKQLNLYLLVFSPACRAGGCAVDELLGPAIESGWKDWTLYEADDLVDTGFDCLSCHQPDGPGSPRRLLMRDLPMPWFHWFLPPDAAEDPCPEQQAPLHELPDLKAIFDRAHADDPTYGGLPPSAFRQADGHNLHSMVLLFQAALSSSSADGAHSVAGAGDPYVLDSRKAVDEYRCTGKSPTWDAYRERTLLARGLPIPELQFNRLDAVASAGAQHDYGDHLREVADAQPSRRAFDVAAGWISEDVQQDIGARVRPGQQGEVMLRQMCARCHDDRAPAGSRRARFRIDRLTPQSAAEARKRIAEPGNSSKLMPPRRSGDTEPLAVQALDAFLAGQTTAGR